jgi:hypothetical protein
VHLKGWQTTAGRISHPLGAEIMAQVPGVSRETRLPPATISQPFGLLPDDFKIHPLRRHAMFFVGQRVGDDNLQYILTGN